MKCPKCGNDESFNFSVVGNRGCSYVKGDAEPYSNMEDNFFTDLDEHHLEVDWVECGLCPFNGAPGAFGGLPEGVPEAEPFGRLDLILTVQSLLEVAEGKVKRKAWRIRQAKSMLEKMGVKP